MTETTATISDRIAKLRNPMDEYREYIAELKAERDRLAEVITSATKAREEINAVLDKEKEKTKETYHMTVRTRRPRKEKVAQPEGVQAEGSEQPKPKRGRPAKQTNETATV